MRRIAREKLGLRTVRALAVQLRVDPGDLSRFLNGHRTPPVSLIAAVLWLYREPFDELFVVECRAARAA